MVTGLQYRLITSPSTGTDNLMQDRDNTEHQSQQIHLRADTSFLLSCSHMKRCTSPAQTYFIHVRIFCSLLTLMSAESGTAEHQQLQPRGICLTMLVAVCTAALCKHAPLFLSTCKSFCLCWVSVAKSSSPDLFGNHISVPHVALF